ncbi:MAG: hypothetical protein AVDCRST_MAG93-2854 [uncultured Chloroflexia bacterium]|uniref:Uncharacterized protein n=1 Tax=uncultured Chloroflexia bacterium TaxID=1672391 RepID=A0A6J4JAW3_9CHLR|nr:MAG: hypothetical protein AVDCRST_MAG93-2854 [uncultured Chloroflexia bacterium]
MHLMSNVSASVSQRITVQTCFNTDLPTQLTLGVQASFA